MVTTDRDRLRLVGTPHEFVGAPTAPEWCTRCGATVSMHADDHDTCPRCANCGQHRHGGPCDPEPDFTAGDPVTLAEHLELLSAFDLAQLVRACGLRLGSAKLLRGFAAQNGGHERMSVYEIVDAVLEEAGGRLERGN